MGSECLLIAPGVKLLYKNSNIDSPPDYPRGILSLASFLNYRGIKTELFILDNYLLTDENVFHNDFEINSEIKKLIKNILNKNNIILIGIGLAYSMQFNEVKRITKICKEIAPQIKIVIGGPHSTFLPERTLEEIPEADIIIRGEGEWTLADLISKIKNHTSLDKVEGITFRERSGKPVNCRNRELGNTAELPPLDYSLIPEGYVRKLSVCIVSSRGCRYDCSYCAERFFWGKKIRLLKDENTFNELKQLIDVYKCRTIAFEDSMFDLRSRRFFNFCDKLSNYYNPDSLEGRMYILSRVDTISKEGLKKAYDSGIKAISFGMESASEKVLTIMNKKTTREMIINACMLAKEIGFYVAGFWIIGHPGDNFIEFQKTYNTIDYLFKEGLLDNIEFSKFIPYPGTQPFNFKEKYGVEILSYDWSKYGRFAKEVPISQLVDFKREEIHACWLMLWHLVLRQRKLLRQKKEESSSQKPYLKK